MQFNPAALLAFVVFFALIALAASHGGSALHLAEAGVTLLILLALAGLEFRGGRRS